MKAGTITPCKPTSAPVYAPNSLDMMTMWNTEAIPNVTSAKVIPFTRGRTSPNKTACRIAARKTNPNAGSRDKPKLLMAMPVRYAPTAKNME